MSNLPTIPKLSRKQIENRSRKDLSRYKERAAITSIDYPLVPDDIAKVNWGVEVVYGSDYFSAASNGATELAAYSCSEEKIYVNDSDPGFNNRVNFTVAHEVGHISLHKYLLEHAESKSRPLDGLLRKDKLEQIEYEAETYASYLLMPTVKMKEEIKFLSDDGILDLSLNRDKLCDKFGVSKQALEIRLSDFPIKIKGREYEEHSYNPHEFEMQDLEQARKSWSREKDTS